MRISVECGGFTRAADACLAANQTSALLTQSLAGRLVAGAGMAGNDATSASFARAYDASAPAALAALADLTHAFIGAGRLLAATGSEHAKAEAAAAHAVSAYSGRGLDDDAFVRVSPPRPPSSLGAQEPSLGAVDRWILDQVEGFVWPGGDVTALRATASAWRRAAASTDGLADHVDAAITFLESQRSPEIPVAADALADLRDLVLDTAWQLGSLATACDDYADAIDDTRERTRALLEEIGRMIVEGVAISTIATAISGSLGGGASATAAVAKIREKFPRFVALLTALRASVATASARLQRVLDDLADLRTRVEGWLRVPARNERGELRHPLAWLSKDARFEASPKHGSRPNGRAAAGPRNGQQALEDSVAVNPSTTTRRVAYDGKTEEFVVFDETTPGVFHGHVRSWGELSHAMQRALVEAGVVDRKGRAMTRGGS
ncbi:hypothetical protein SAMN04489844_0627 [Nocardioides exalbidus]|uniref:Uncharacterized protein n=1 Tax=Nocardioides exalbidus TaxID=402596 RepID=A0A1H4KLU5_9ACTN|nr:hypothetical protein [Nocardioides exalbidus]SEB59461.1 hypothetical protein SAMN04489844_0627 [Nocardioides exalbidus]